MNILVINLLDLKDLLLINPVLKQLKEDHFHSKIHLLINEKNKEVKNFLSFADEIISLPLSFFPKNFFLKDFSSRNEFYRDSFQNKSLNLKEGLRPLYEKNFFEHLLFDSHFPNKNHLREDLHQFKLIMKELMERDYDMIVNLTHNTVSGWLSFFLKSPNKFGLHFNSKGMASFGSAWFRYFDDSIQKEKSLFHPCDIFCSALSGKEKKSNFEIETTDLRNLEASKILEKITETYVKMSSSNPHWIPYNNKNSFQEKINFILFQPLKDADLNKGEVLYEIKEKINEIFKSLPFPTCFLFFDETNSKLHYLKSLEKESLKSGLPLFSLQMPSLDAMFSLLEKSSLSLTRGASIFQQMASFSNTNLVEFHFSKEEKISASSYKEGNLIIEASHYKAISSSLFSKIFKKGLLSQFNQEFKNLDLNLNFEELTQNSIQNFNDENSSQRDVKIYKSSKDTMGFWVKVPLFSGFKNPKLNLKFIKPKIEMGGKRKDLNSKKMQAKMQEEICEEKEKIVSDEEMGFQFIQDFFERLSWKLFFDKEHLKNLGSYGTESLKAKPLLNRFFKQYEEDASHICSKILTTIERKTENFNDSIKNLIELWAKTLRTRGKNEWRTFLGELEKLEELSSPSYSSLSPSSPSLSRSSSLPSVVSSISSSSLQEKLNPPDLFFLRGLQNKIDDISNKNQIQLKLVRSVRSLMEVEG